MLNILQRAEKFYELKQFPKVKGLLFEAVRGSFKKPSSSSKAVHLGVQLDGVKFDRQWVQHYKKECGFENSNDIPLTVPQVLAAPLHLFLFTRKAHPFPVFGMVHVRNSFELYDSLKYEQSYTFAVLIGETRQASKGCEFDVITEVYADETLVCRSVMTVLSRIKGMASSSVAAKDLNSASMRLNLAHYLGFKAAAKQGLHYAKVSGDYNPIHLHFLTARLFGFKQPVAHGMWTAAACLAKLENKIKKPCTCYDVSFRKPVFMPSHSVLKYETQKSEVHFELLSIKGSSVQVKGKLGL